MLSSSDAINLNKFSLIHLLYAVMLPHCSGAMYCKKDESIIVRQCLSLKRAIQTYFNRASLPQFPFHHCTIVEVAWCGIVWVVEAPLG